MATANYSWPNLNSPQQPTTAATVVDTNPPRNLSPWTQREPYQQDVDAWPKPKKKLSERAPRRRTPMTDPSAFAGQRSRSMGGWLVVCSLLACAAGVVAAPALSSYADDGVEGAMAWLTPHAPAFLRAYLPKPIEKSVAPVVHHARARMPPAPESAALPERTGAKTQHAKRRPSHGPARPAAHASQGSDPFDQ